MRNLPIFSLLSSLIIFCLLCFACSRSEIVSNDESFPSVVGSDAGEDRGIVLPRDTVTLFGSGIAYYSTITNYKWVKISGPTPGMIVNPGSPVTLLRGLVSGVYKFQLEVTNSDGKTAIDKACVTVYDPTQCGSCGNY